MIKIRIFLTHILTILLIFTLSLPAFAEEIVSLRPEIPEQDIKYTVEEEQEYINFIKNRIKTLKESGMNPDIFENLTIEIYPARSIPFKYNTGNLETYFAKGLTKNHNTITIAVGTGENTFFHELGHIIERRFFDAYGYN